MSDNETNNNSLVPIHNTGLIKVGNIIKITDKILKEYFAETKEKLEQELENCRKELSADLV